MKNIFTALDSFKSGAESVCEKLTAFGIRVREQTAKPLSADVHVIKADLRLIKVL